MVEFFSPLHGGIFSPLQLAGGRTSTSAVTSAQRRAHTRGLPAGGHVSPGRNGHGGRQATAKVEFFSPLQGGIFISPPVGWRADFHVRRDYPSPTAWEIAGARDAGGALGVTGRMALPGNAARAAIPIRCVTGCQYGGGEGSRTPVLNSVTPGFSMLSRLLV